MAQVNGFTQENGSVHIDMSAPADNVSTGDASSEDTGTAGASSVTRSVRALRTTLRTPRKLKILGAVAFGLLGVVAIGLDIAYQNGSSNSSSSTSDAASIAVTPMGEKEENVTHPQHATSFFLRADFSNAGVFLLSKAHWNDSFIVYPTIEKHSGTPQSGRERGSSMLETSDYVFHFERSVDGQSLLLVPENHRARYMKKDDAKYNNTDELQDVFDNSQWPGYSLSVPIFEETNDTFQFAMGEFIVNGFFVSTALASTSYDVLQEGSVSYPRNSILRVQYELQEGIALVSYAIGLFPETLMRQRIADDRVGYFSTRFVQYGIDSSDTRGNDSSGTYNGFHSMDPQMTMLNRRRLEIDPKTNATKKPIMYYIDPSVPSRWRKAFVAGVEAWNPAFEAIGFKDAIKVVLPGDAEWPVDYRLGDLRYNSISVMISDQTYALGPTIVDPRSGEILHSDILFEYGFFDEVMTDFDQRSHVNPPEAAVPSTSTTASQRHRLRQCGIAQHVHHKIDRMLLGMFASDGMTGFVPDDIIGRHFTDTVMHEVGHTLGLRHNFAGSAGISCQELNDDEFVKKHGVSSSIMDYVPVNIFSDLTPDRAKTHQYYMMTIGAYDTAAIAYGYAIAGNEAPGFKSAQLTELARQTPLFLTDEDTDVAASPYGQRFDLSSDPIDFANDRLELAKSLRKTQLLNKIPNDAPWSTLWWRESSLLRMLNGTIDFLNPMLGGVNVSHAHRGDGETKYAPSYISKDDQMRVLAVLARIIRADDGLFPAAQDYSTYVQVLGYEDEDCSKPTSEAGCLARGLVSVDAKILSIQKHAVLCALFPAMTRIVEQDVNAPLTLTELLAEVRNATSSSLWAPRNKALQAFLYTTLQQTVDDKSTDPRVVEAIVSIFPTITPTTTAPFQQ
ncbi:hypothetical protein FI667_g5439, partial [Globisporangium splendens]